MVHTVSIVKLTTLARVDWALTRPPCTDGVNIAARYVE